jgi:hypothetical protein
MRRRRVVLVWAGWFLGVAAVVATVFTKRVSGSVAGGPIAVEVSGWALGFMLPVVILGAVLTNRYLDRRRR